MSTTVNINANIITWAVARAGYELQEFTEKHPKVAEWIAGEKSPTVKQLEDFSKKVHLPFGYFFLPEPPQEKLPIPFFRSEKGRAQQVPINVYDTIQLIRQRQDWLKEYLKENDFEPLAFVGRYYRNHNVSAIVGDIRKTLGLYENWASEYPTWQAALDGLTERIEEAGIITVFNGVVENNTSRPIPVEDCRGFVMVDALAPFMFINNADSKAAQMFTIVHELAHVWTGYSAGFDFRQMQPSADAIERLCDQVAAELLVPAVAFQELWTDYSDIKSLARHFKVSEIVIARRAMDTGKISREQFFGFYNEYIHREFTKKEGQKSGGDFYATAKKRIGLSFAAHVNNAVKSGKLLYRDAYKLTGLKGDTFQHFYSKYF